MAATNAPLAFGGMTQHCWRWGWRMFFECPPNRRVAGAIDNLQFHDLFLQQPQGPARASLGGLEQASAINLASFSPSKIRATAGVARCLRLNTASKPSSTSCFRTR